MGSLHRFMHVPLHLLASRYRQRSTFTVFRHTSWLGPLPCIACKGTRR